MKKSPFFSFLTVSILGTILGYILSHSYDFGICGVSLFCKNLMLVGNALFYSMPTLALSFALLMFVPRAVKPWKYFAIWYLPLMLIFFITYKNDGLFSVPEESVYRFFSVVYGVVSVAIIAIVAAVKGTKRN